MATPTTPTRTLANATGHCLTTLWSQGKLAKKDNIVVVRIWEKSWLHMRLGHVSLESIGQDNFYASFWPMNADRSKDGVPGEFNESLEADKRSESDLPPSHTIVLRGLDTEAMHEEFLSLRFSGLFWSAWASKSVPDEDKDDDVHNCVSVCLQLLKKGGVEKILGQDLEQLSCMHTSRTHPVITPKKILDLVRLVQKKEQVQNQAEPLQPFKFN